MITNFDIDNFRGIKHIEMRGIKPLTIITGKNNAGKSTILEALFLFNAHSDPNVFSMLSGLRNGTFEPTYRIWTPLFNAQDTTETIRFAQNYSEENAVTLKFVKNQDFAVDSYSLAEGDKVESNLSLKAVPYTLSFEYVEPNYNESGRFTATNNGISLDITTSNVNNERNLMPFTIITQSTLPRMEQQVVDWVGKLELMDQKEYAIEALRVIDPTIRDVVSASIDGINQLYVKNYAGTIPLKYAGYGMMRLLYIVSILLTNKNSLLLFDEIETGFHYSMYDSLWKLIARYSLKNNNQVIATSHSYENIAKSLNGIAEEGRESDFSLHRIERDADGIHEDKDYGYDKAALAIKAGLEVR